MTKHAASGGHTILESLIRWVLAFLLAIPLAVGVCGGLLFLWLEYT